MNDRDAVSPMLPLLAQLPTTVVLCAVILVALRIADGTSARFVVFACWLRFMLAAFHEYTYDKVFANLSSNAIASVAVFVLGVSLLRRSLFLSKALVPVYLLLAVIVLSAVANGGLFGSFDTIVKFGYFVVVALNTYEALRTGDRRRFSIALLLSFTPLLVFQALSLLLNVSKGSAADASRSFIGGYNHEAAFSVALVALFITASMAEGIRGAVRNMVLIIAVVGIILANYRTAIIGMLPLAGYFLLTALCRMFDRRLRPVVVLVAAFFLVTVGGTAIIALERFEELQMIIEGEAQVIKPPEEFTWEDRGMLSGRAYIWSSYYYTWEHGGQVQDIVGYGPDSWEKFFTVYAHNSFISFLFEYGIVGVAALLIFMGSGWIMASRAEPGRRAKLMAAHASFVVLNLATMPMWQIEGLILYSILWGFTMDSFFRRTVPGGQSSGSSDFVAALP